MIGNFVYLQKKRITRSSFWQKNLAINILVGFFMLIVLLELLAVGFFLEKILTGVGKGLPPEQLLNKELIYYFLFTFVMRFFIQKLPAMEISPLLHLPLKKNRISLFLNYRSLLSFFNFLPFFLFLPFTIHYLAAHYSAPAAFVWFAGIFLFEMSSNFLLIRVKRQSTVKPAVVLVIFALAAVIGLLEEFHIFSLSVISEWYFGHLLQQPAWVLLPLATTLIFFWQSFRYIRRHSYLEDIGRKKRRSENLSCHDSPALPDGL